MAQRRVKKWRVWSPFEPYRGEHFGTKAPYWRTLVKRKRRAGHGMEWPKRWW